MRSEDYGKHLLDVENLLHKHSLIESQIQSQGESVQRINNVAQRFIKAKHPENRVIKERQSLLAQAFEVYNWILHRDFNGSRVADQSVYLLVMRWLSACSLHTNVIGLLTYNSPPLCSNCLRRRNRNWNFPKNAKNAEKCDCKSQNLSAEPRPPLHSQDLFSNSPYCLQYNYDVGLQNLVLDQLLPPKWYYSLFSLVVCLILYWYC